VPDALLDFLRLRLRTLAATPGFSERAEVGARLTTLYDRARTLGLVHERVPNGAGEAIAQVVFFRDPKAWFGGAVVLGWIDRDPADAAAIGPVLAAIDRHRERLGAETLIEVGVHDGPLLAGLEARGFGIDSVIQVGEPRTALAALGPNPGGGLGASLALVPLQAKHVSGVVDLHRRVFSAEPAWCWFGAYPRHLERIGRDLRADPEGHFVVLARGAGGSGEPGDEVVGHLGAELADSPYWGRVGGLELVVAAPLRGCGLARPLYRAALASLIARGAERMKGGTSQPGVLALGRVMQRPWQAFNLRRDTPFGRDHFLRFAPAEVRTAHA